MLCKVMLSKSYHSLHHSLLFYSICNQLYFLNTIKLWRIIGLIFSLWSIWGNLLVISFLLCIWLGVLFKVSWGEAREEEYSCSFLLVAWVGKQSILFTLPCMSYSPPLCHFAARFVWAIKEPRGLSISCLFWSCSTHKSFFVGLEGLKRGFKPLIYFI